MSTDPSPEGGLRPVKFSRLPRRGVLLGLTPAQLITLGTGGVILLIALYTGTGLLLASAAPVVIACLVLAFVHVAGRPLVGWVPVGFWWAWRTLTHQLNYRRRIVAPRPAGTLALPGDMARLREYTDPETGACMVHDPHHATLTAICEITHPAFILLDPGEQERRVTAWGRGLASTCRTGNITTLQVLEHTLPDSGTALTDWWESHGINDGSWAATTYAELIDRAGPAGEHHATTISLSLNLKAAARQIRAHGGGLRGAAAVLRQEMTTLTTALRTAELTVTGWLTPDQLAVILRGAYDPAIATTLQRHPELGRDLATAGPVTVTETWNSLRTDTAHHAVLWLSEWPRTLVYPGFLAPILLTTGIHRTLSLLYTPMRTDQAARDIRKKKVEHLSDRAQRAKIGQVEDAAQTAEYADVLQQEADLTAGHGILRTAGLITLTALTPEQLESAVVAIEQAAIQASCETRRLCGQQAQAFTAAALPLCRRV